MLSHTCQRALCSGFVPQIELIHRDLGHTPAMGGEATHKDEPLEGCFHRDLSSADFCPPGQDCADGPRAAPLFSADLPESPPNSLRQITV